MYVSATLTGGSVVSGLPLIPGLDACVDLHTCLQEVCTTIPRPFWCPETHIRMLKMRRKSFTSGALLHTPLEREAACRRGRVRQGKRTAVYSRHQFYGHINRHCLYRSSTSMRHQTRRPHIYGRQWHNYSIWSEEFSEKYTDEKSITRFPCHLFTRPFGWSPGVTPALLDYKLMALFTNALIDWLIETTSPACVYLVTFVRPWPWTCDLDTRPRYYIRRRACTKNEVCIGQGVQKLRARTGHTDRYIIITQHLYSALKSEDAEALDRRDWTHYQTASGRGKMRWACIEPWKEWWVVRIDNGERMIRYQSINPAGQKHNYGACSRA